MRQRLIYKRWFRQRSRQDADLIGKTKPYLIDQASNAKLMVPNPPKVGPLRNSNKPKADRVYFMFFGNPGKFVKAGNKVTVVIGDFKAENLTVK